MGLVVIGFGRFNPCLLKVNNPKLSCTSPAHELASVFFVGQTDRFLLDLEIDIIRMAELEVVFNKAVEHVVKICEGTLEEVEKSQTGLMSALQDLEARLKRIAEVNEKLNDNRMAEACQNIMIYKAKIERVKGRLGELKKRIAGIETKIMLKN